ncbi:MAG: hypothetical protein KDD64_02875 [Bdellovibrionales bacterium]|nr:hypothetical protein [Bdellovibrionales bacterium]
MKLVSAFSFLESSGLSSEALAFLLEHKLIRCEVGPDGGVLFDLASLTEEAALRALVRPDAENRSEAEDDDQLLEARIAKALSDFLPAVIDDVVRYLQAELDGDDEAPLP